MVGLSMLVVGRIFYLQVIKYETYASLGEENSIRQEYVNASRGLIYDRNGVLLVDNEPIFSITITPATFDKEKIPFLAELLEEDEQSIRERIKEAQIYSWYRSSPLLTDVNFEIFTRIQENWWRLPGIGHQVESKRNYPSPVKASHLLGYLREADQQDYDQTRELRLGDKIGKSGLEMIYEPELRGDFGLEFITVNALGQTMDSYEGERSPKDPVQGSDLITTIDAELQEFTETLMQGKIGAAIAMDPSNGEILALVSSPQYDVSRLAGRLDHSYWAQINSDSTRPLYNRVISARQPPGSTFKPLMGLIGLELGLITPETVVTNTGGYRRGRLYRDIAAKGDYTLETAITFSSNTYFNSLMDKIASAGYLNVWSEMVKDFGLGTRPDIDLPSAVTGIVPDSSYMDQRFGKGQWGLGDLINLGIGQGVISVSPVQVAQMTSAIANGGYRVTPHLIKTITDQDGNVVRNQPPVKAISWVKPEYLDVIKRGMHGVVQEGSGRYYAKTDLVDIAGKTGTAQNPHGFSHGWFTSFAPYENPQIVVTVFLENAGFASTSAAPVASLMIEKYLTKQVERPYIYNYVMNWVPKEDNSQGVQE